MLYDRFTELAKRVMVAAQDAAISLGHDFIGTEHLLLGLACTAGTASEALRQHGLELGRARDETARVVEAAGNATGGQAAKDALSSLGIDVAEIQRRADDSFGPGAFKFPRPAWSLGAKTALKVSLEEATRLGQQRIDTEHLLLGVLADGEDPACRILAALEIDITALRQTVLDSATRQAA